MLSIDLRTVRGEKIQIIHPGTHNPDAGPDFLFAKIRISDTLWAGNVEIHVAASDWFRHKHQNDPAYNNVILHVVADNDSIATNQSGRELQSLCIDGQFNNNLLNRYKEINENLLWVPCMKLIRKVDKIQVISSIHAHSIERLGEKANFIRKELNHCNNDWEECCYRMIAIHFGARVNTNQFEMLSKTLPVRILMKYHKQLFQLEALLYGQSGLLNMKLIGVYPRKLKKEYAFLSGKHQLSPMPGYLWKFLRLRPAAFPTIRIAHLAKLYEQHQSLFLEITEKKNIQSLIRLFEVSASDYWDDHYIFDRKSKGKKKKFGSQGIQLLLINAITLLFKLFQK